MEKPSNTTDPNQQIAVEAYYLWESEGSQPGRDLEYWMRAKEIVGRNQKTRSSLQGSNTQSISGNDAQSQAGAGSKDNKKARKQGSTQPAGALVE